MYKPPTSKSLPWLPCVPAPATQVMTGWCCLPGNGAGSGSEWINGQKEEKRVAVQIVYHTLREL